ncbi:MAG: hypothetical protein Q8P18_32160 [Pseudomonadota bacterium]|nr:hypothetical protein [Pseudomonadota bacterium]
MQVAFGVLLVVSAGLLSVLEVLPTLDVAVCAHIAAFGVHWLVSTGWLAGQLVVRWRARLPLRLVAAGMALCLLHGPLAFGKLVSYAGQVVVVSVDRAGDGYGPEYPDGPKVLLRTPGERSTSAYYFRRLVWGVFLGPERWPYRG